MTPTHLRVKNAVLPRVDPEDLDDLDRAYIPAWDPHHVVEESFLEFLALCVARDQPGLIVGPAGCGKSSGVMLLAAALGQPVMRVNLHGDVRGAHLFGQNTLAPDPETGSSRVVWRDGVVATALRRKWWLVMDEYDGVPAGIAMGLNAPLEPARRLVLLDNGGEVIDGLGARLFATANTLGSGDDSGLYAGTQVLNEATLDRFAVYRMTYPTVTAETEAIVSRSGMVETLARKMAEFAMHARKDHDGGKLTCTMSTRKVLAWAQLAVGLSVSAKSVGTDTLATGFRFAVLNKADAESAAALRSIYERIFGLRITP